MKLLDFNLHSFARINYVSKEIKEVWAPKLEKAAKAYNTLERLTVIEGLRDATTGYMNPMNMDQEQRELLQQGLTFVPVRKIKKFKAFSHVHEAPKKGDDWAYYGVIVREASAAKRWLNAEELSDPIDHRTLAELLGYPTCCVDAFYKNWVDDKYIDPIWQIAQETSRDSVKKEDDTNIRFGADLPWETNIMLRYIGVRLVPHMPCSFDCEHTYQMTQDWLEVGRKHNVEGLEELQEILSMNISWDAFKGIAIVSNPIMKVTTNSVACYPNYIVEREGTHYPDDAPTGVKFPFKIPKKVNRIEELRKLQAEGKVPVHKA